MTLSEQRARTSEELDVGEVARRKIAVFGCEARQIMLACVENYRRHGHFKTATFWQAVADTVEAISDPVAKQS
jgi:hypothetical protein